MTSSRFSIRNQLMVLAVVATGSIWAGALIQYRQLLAQSVRLHQIRDGLEVAEAYSGIASAAARERGLTNGAMLDGDGKGPDVALEQARGALDDALTRIGTTNQHKMDTAVAYRVDELPHYRSLVDHRAESPALVFGWYSRFIAAVNDSAAKHLGDGMVEVSIRYEHVNDLTQATEHLAQVRGMVYGVLTSGEMDPTTLLEVYNQLSLHDEYLRLYDSSAPAASLAANADELSSPAEKQTLELAHKLIDNHGPQGLGLSRQEWWKVASEAVDTLRKVALREMQQLTSAADQRMQHLERQMRGIVIILVVLGLFTLGLTLTTIGRVVRGLNTLLTGLDNVSSGGFKTRIDGVRADEFGTISGGINKLISIASTVLDEREKESATDPLTGLLNRRGFDAKAGATMQAGREAGLPSGLLLLDIDRFKTINDRFGHPTGDRVLVTLAHILRGQVRAGDCVGRYGGEEFLVLLGGCDIDTGLPIAEKLREQIATSDFGLGEPVTVSIGIAQWQTGTSVAELVTSADTALYQAKANGRNRVVPFVAAAA